MVLPTKIITSVGPKTLSLLFDCDAHYWEGEKVIIKQLQQRTFVYDNPVELVSIKEALSAAGFNSMVVQQENRVEFTFYDDDEMLPTLKLDDIIVEATDCKEKQPEGVSLNIVVRVEPKQGQFDLNLLTQFGESHWIPAIEKRALNVVGVGVITGGFVKDQGVFLTADKKDKVAIEKLVKRTVRVNLEGLGVYSPAPEYQFRLEGGEQYPQTQQEQQVQLQSLQHPQQQLQQQNQQVPQQLHQHYHQQPHQQHQYPHQQHNQQVQQHQQQPQVHPRVLPVFPSLAPGSVRVIYSETQFEDYTCSTAEDLLEFSASKLGPSQILVYSSDKKVALLSSDKLQANSTFYASAPLSYPLVLPAQLSLKGNLADASFAALDKLLVNLDYQRKVDPQNHDNYTFIYGKNGRKNGMIVVEKSVEWLSEVTKGRKIAFLSVVGPPRHGKSTFMNLLKRKFGDESISFTTSDEKVTAHTMGIWATPVHKAKCSVTNENKDDENSIVIFLDSEGLFALDGKGESYHVRMFTIMTVLSSCMIFNKITPSLADEEFPKYAFTHSLVVKYLFFSQDII